MATCNRCNKETRVMTGSYFNTEMICMECDTLERAHPKFKEAQRVELEQVQKRNFNFEGIGLPKELRK